MTEGHVHPRQDRDTPTLIGPLGQGTPVHSYGGYPIPGPDRGVHHPRSGLGGIPSCLWGVTPSQVWMAGHPIPGLDGGYPIPGQDGVYPIPGLDGRVLHPVEGGYPHPRSGQGYLGVKT